MTGQDRIFAVDVEEPRDVIRLISQLNSRPEILASVAFVKVGLVAITGGGLSLIRKVKRRTRLEVICDLKISDIPTVAAALAKRIARAGGDGLVVHGFVGREVLDAIQATTPELKIFLLTEMTHEGSFTALHLEDMAALGKERNVFAVIGPGNKPERLAKLRAIVGTEIRIVAAGVTHYQNGTAKAALEAGADYIIEGRTLIRRLDEEPRIADLRRRVVFWTAIAVLAIGALLALRTTSIITAAIDVRVFGSVLVAWVFAVGREILHRNNR